MDALKDAMDVKKSLSNGASSPPDSTDSSSSSDPSVSESLSPKNMVSEVLGGQDGASLPSDLQDGLAMVKDPKQAVMGAITGGDGNESTNTGQTGEGAADDNAVLTTGDKDLDDKIKKGANVAKQASKIANAAPVAAGTANTIAQMMLLHKIAEALKAMWAAIVKATKIAIDAAISGTKFVAGLLGGAWNIIKGATVATAAAAKTAFIAAPVATSIVAVSVTSVGAVGTVAGVTTYQEYAKQEQMRRLEEEVCGSRDESKSKKSKSDQASSAADASAGDWTVEGSKSYNLAKELFRVLTEEYGLSGTSAAGWLGNVQAESDFNPDMVEAENGQNYSGRGYGLFQFTPGEKYLNSTFFKKGRPMEEEVKAQVDFIFASEFINGGYKSYLPNASDWFGLSGVDSIEDILDQDDVEKAMLIFFSVYERGDVAQMHRERRLSAAKKANEMFNKDNIKADRSKWKVDTASSGEPGDAAKASKSKSKKEEDPCGDSSSDKASGDLGKASSKDVQAALEKLKKDVDSARPIGNTECYALVSQYINYLSGHTINAGVSGSPIPAIGDTESASQIGHGYDFASVGYSVKKNATAKDIEVGDIVNTAGTATNQWGHTVVVAKVNGDGTFDLFEQNYAGKRYAAKHTRGFADGEITSIVRFNGKKK